MQEKFRIKDNIAPSAKTNHTDSGIVNKSTNFRKFYRDCADPIP